MNRRSMKTWTSQADTATHLRTLVGLARCGLSPTLFWWTNATLVAAAETVHVVREKVVEQNAEVIDLCKTLDRFSASDVVVATEVATSEQGCCDSAVRNNGMAQMCTGKTLGRFSAVATVVAASEQRCCVSAQPSNGMAQMCPGTPLDRTTDEEVATKAATSGQGCCDSAQPSKGMAQMCFGSLRGAGDRRASKGKWGEEFVTCTVCQKQFRRSNRSYHMKSDFHMRAAGRQV